MPSPSWSNLNDRVQMAEKISADRAAIPAAIIPRRLDRHHPAYLIADRLAKAAAARIPGVYAAFQKELAERNRLLAILPRLRRFTTFLSARDELAAAGIPLTDDECGAFESQDAPAESRAGADGRLAREIVRKLEQLGDKTAQQSIRAAIEELEADLHRMDAFRDLERKYGPVHVPLRGILGEAIGHLHTLLGQTFDLSWSGDADPRWAISLAIFPPDSPIEVPAPTPAPPSASGQPGTLRSAADVASARG